MTLSKNKIDFGLTEEDLQSIAEILQQYPQVDEALVFGSRAKGNYKPGSDVDIVLKGKLLNFKTTNHISYLLNEETRMPYKFDVLNYNEINNKDLIEHIDRVGVEFYSRWKKIQLREISSDISYGYTASATNENIGPKFLRITDITNGKINWDTVPFCNISEKDINKYRLEVGDIVIARTGATTGFNAIIKKEVYAVYASYLIRFQIDKNKANPFFIGYILQSEKFQDYVDAIAGGSAQPGANAQQFADYEFYLPPFLEQTAIVSILNSLDDKIDLLQRQNKTLEQLAETLFRQWFVEEADESWEIKFLQDFGKIICGKTPSKQIHKYFNGEIPFIKIPDMHNKVFIFETEDSLTFDGADSQSNKFLPPQSICVSCIATVGLVVINAKLSQTNQQINSIIPVKDYYRYFLYLKMKSVKDELLAMASGGTATDNLNTGNFSNISFRVPSDEVFVNFNNKIKVYFDKIFKNTIQIKSLTQLRDSLLPRLMSGDIRLN